MFNEGGCLVYPERGHGEPTLVIMSDRREAEHLFGRFGHVNIISEGPRAVHWTTLLRAPKEKLLQCLLL